MIPYDSADNHIKLEELLSLLLKEVSTHGGKTILPASAETKLQEQMRQAQKMETLGILARGIAHDFGHIIQNIRNHTAVTLHDLSFEQHEEHKINYRNQIKKINEEVSRAELVVISLSAFADKTIVERKPIDLLGIIGSIVKLLNRILPESIELETHWDNDIWRINAKVNEIEQVFLNIAVNACDAMPEGGIIEISLSNLQSSGRCVIGGTILPRGDYVCLSISDTGVGMDESTKEKIFDPYFSTKEKGKGTGLGLSIVFGIIKNHEGFIDVISAPMKGTIFQIYLPKA